MPKTKIIIGTNIEKSFQKVLDKFKEDLKIGQSVELNNYKTTINTSGPMGKSVRVKQIFNVDYEGKTIRVESHADRAVARTVYEFKKKGDDTELIYSEYSSGTQSKIQTLNYLLFELPIFNMSTKNKMKRKLEMLKESIEGRMV